MSTPIRTCREWSPDAVVDVDEQRGVAVVGGALSGPDVEVAPKVVAGDVAVEPVLNFDEPVSHRVALGAWGLESALEIKPDAHEIALGETIRRLSSSE